MPLDVKTLFLLTVDVEAMLGLLLLFAWVQNTGITALAWWGSAHLLRTLSIALYGMFGSVPELVSLDLSNALLFTSYAVGWSGARVFDDRRPRPGWVITGATVWVAACQIGQFAQATELRALLGSAIVAAFLWLTAFEFWRGRAERLLSRWPAVFILFAHGAIFLLRSPLSTLMPGNPGDPALASAWMTVISTEEVLATISIAFILLAMAKERTELHHKTAAMVDSLTGLANRRAFLDSAAQLTQTQTARDVPVAVFMIDLDRFKSVNDRFGHSIGDDVLRIFAESARANVRASDIVGRLGGEEFAVLLADACRDNAFKVAERIRASFAATAAMVGGHPVNATASIGVAIIQDPCQDIVALLSQADQALYRAKARGRNRVVVIGLDLLMDGGDDAAAQAVSTRALARPSRAA
ncbi:MAG TPA: GGDEF domain-containing protein [Xanthobacteraceae bacterium]|nr:GGDEF domain-containing protein [Xanthobacteraceae bacterium]